MQLSSHDEFVYGQRDTYRIKVALNDVIIAIFRTLNLEWPILTYKQRYFFQIFQPKRKHCSCWFRDAYLIWEHSLCKGVVEWGWRVIFCHPLLSTTSYYQAHLWSLGQGRLCPPPVYWCPHLVLKATGAPDYQCDAMSPPIFSTFRRPYYS